ncbi:MAG: hypothetical protein JSS76_11610 [Bacteroidetes bacterium]|nr:hypothetical protein [Bacteroidota bacterium]MBS1685399.1 hypothetical protein [Bacteroidota bacterium]
MVISCTSRLHAAGGPAHSVLSRGGTPTDSLYYKGNAEKLRQELKYYRGMKATGGAITGLGALFFVGGQSLLWTSVAMNETGRRGYKPVARDPMFLSGLGATVLTVIPMAFGVPLLRFGTKQVRELKKELH